MEENSNFTMDGQNVLIVNIEAKRYLAEISKWAKFLSIVGFVGVGLLVLLGLFMGTIMSRFGSISGIGAAQGMMIGSMSFIYVVIAALYVYPLWKLYQFADLSQKSLAYDNSMMLTNALEAQKSVFKFMGIWVIVVLSLYTVMIIVGIISFLFIGRGL